jgi:hypothetical protein
MRTAAIIAVLAFLLTAPSTAPARIYSGAIRYAKPRAISTLGGSSISTSDAPYLSYVSLAYNDHSGALVVKYAFYQPLLWTVQRMPNPPEVLLGPVCTHTEGVESLVAEPHELLLEVGQAATGGGAPRTLGLAHLAGYAREMQGSPLAFHSGYYRVAVTSSSFRARKWRCLTVAPAAQAGPGGPFSLELDGPASVRMSRAAKTPVHKAGVQQARETTVARAARERREEHEEERATERKEEHERREERLEARKEERKEHRGETASEREEREELEEERREEEEERLEELKELQEELAERRTGK